jgi:hypothetical protein
VETPRFFKDGVWESKDVNSILVPHKPRIAECIYTGFDFLLDIREKYPKRYAQLSPTTRAGIVHDETVACASQVFKGLKPDVAIVPALGSIVITFQEKVALRFKKLSDNLEANNIQTKQQKDFNQQTLWPDLCNVTAGYRLDPTGHEIRDIQIVCWYRDELLWNIEVPYKRGDVLKPRGISDDDMSGPPVRAKLPRLGPTGTADSL